MRNFSHQVFVFLFLFLLPGAAISYAGTGAEIAGKGTPAGVPACVTCHGADGGGMAAASYPRLAGLDAGYLARQLRDFRGGTRTHAVMSSMAMSLKDDEIEAVSAYYASLPVPASTATTPSGEAALVAAKLATRGDWPLRSLPACAECHGPDGNGVGTYFPGISGQVAGYIKAQLMAWKSGTRANDPVGLMKSVADSLTEAEIDAVANYYAALPGAVPAPATNAPAPVDRGNVAAPDQVHSGEVVQHGAPPAGRPVSNNGYFEPPPREEIPEGPFGDVIARGQAIFENTNAHPVSSGFVGNDQACGNCHLDAGRLAESSPLWAAWVAYPAYREKNRKVNTYIERVQGCFEYSMNARASPAGAPPAADSDTIVSLVAYSYWLASGAPTGDVNMPGRGYPRLDETSRGFDPERGAVVYTDKCALCHGEDGAGVTLSDGRTLFPPLWGAESYNWGAGMHRIDTAAAFIRHNMPLGRPDTLTDQEAWDVAAYMNSHERPQDPRHEGDLATTTEKYHGGRFDYFGKRKTRDGHLLGERPAGN